MSINVAQNNGTVAIKQLFKFQKNCKLTRTLALEAVDQGNAENLKKGFYYLLNERKANTSTNWLNVERDSSSDLVELLHDAIRDGYTVRLGIKPANSNTDRDVQEVYGCFLDVDETSTAQTFSNPFSQYACIFYYTPSYIENTNEKHRLVFVFDRVANNLEARIIIRWLYKVQYKSSNPNEKFSDVSCLDPARLFFPSVNSDSITLVDSSLKLGVDEILEQAQQELSHKDLQDCYERSMGVYMPSNGNGNAKKLVSVSELQNETNGKFTQVNYFKKPNSEDTPESRNKNGDITFKIESHIFREVFVKSGYDVNSVFCGIDHNFVEVPPDAGDRRIGGIKCWEGLNPWTSNKSGRSFKVTLLDCDRLIYVARGSGNGEDGGDIRGGITNYWFNIFKGEWQGKDPIFDEDCTELKGDPFEKTIKTFLKYKGKTIPQFFVEYQKERKEGSKSKKKRLTLLEKINLIEESLEGKLRLNEMDGIYYVDDVPVDFECLRSSFEKLTGFALNYEDAQEAVYSIGKKHRYHPFRDYLVANLQKYQDNLDMSIVENISTRYFKTDKWIYDVYMKKMLIGCVARVMNTSLTKGVDFQAAVVIQGWQGCGKTTFWKVLAGEEYFNEGYNPSSHNNKDDLKPINQSVILELGEIESVFKKKDIADLRNFISTAIDQYRGAYERTTKHVVRRSIFVGTVNDSSFLNDPEGTRRFWVIETNLNKREYEMIDNVKLAEERDMLWAVATKLFLDGASYKLTKEENLACLKSNEDFLTVDSFEEQLSKILDNYQSVTIGQLYEKHLSDGKPIERGLEMRISAIMKNKHWSMKRTNYKGKVYRVWQNPDENVKGLTFKDVLERDEVISQAMSNAF